MVNSKASLLTCATVLDKTEQYIYVILLLH
jgi:hypothetical protein